MPVYKKKIFLSLMKQFRVTDYTPKKNIRVQNAINALNIVQFKKHYLLILNSSYIFESVGFLTTQTNNLTNQLLFISYYINLSRFIKNGLSINIPRVAFHTFMQNNIIIFSKPRKQLFMMLYKNKPLFIFTGGLMRIVMNEKKKSNKKNYKVATSLIRLATILLSKKNYIDMCFLKLNDVGSIRSKILKMFVKGKVFYKIYYVIITLRFDKNAQKLNTRRSIKKYVKKRFKIA